MTMTPDTTKFIFVTGGVVSSLGKGIVAASMATLLERRGFRISLSKADPYINIDPGTMNPTQHGEVFVTEDGAETDLDLGHYERFTKVQLSKFNSFSTGQIYDQVIASERKGSYLGATVQVVPHVTSQIKQFIFRASEGADISIIEIGGTVGDIESLPFLETIRQLRYELGSQRVLCMHLTLVPYIAAAGELKSKPTQHSVKELRSIGIQPDILICRSDRPVPVDLKNKIALFCNVSHKHVIDAVDLDSIYRMPLVLFQQGLDELVLDSFHLKHRAIQDIPLGDWQAIGSHLDSMHSLSKEVTIGVIGKYTDVPDAYKSIHESLVHAAMAHKVKVRIQYIDAQSLESLAQSDSLLAHLNGILVPGGFGERGIEGKIKAIHYARIHRIPFLGICLGMQLAAIEFARNVLQLPEATSMEFKNDALTHIIVLLEGQQNQTLKGATMRLGAFPCLITPHTKAWEVYKQTYVSERHRHRYEFNKDYFTPFTDLGMVFSGMSPSQELVEIMELKDHPWFVACQFHPELKSKPTDPHPLFRGFLGSAVQTSSIR